MRTSILIAAACLIMSSSCKKNDSQSGTFQTAQVTFGNGKVYSWVTNDNNGNPVSVGFTLTGGALNNLGIAGDEWMIPLPSQASKTLFDHIDIEWNPQGHEPAGIYDVPHFDFHFYNISDAAQEAIPPYEIDSTGFQNFPAASYLPANYFPTPGGVPHMGKHWVNVLSPEFHGQPFTETFIYGSYNGNVIFQESMITKAYLEGLTDLSKAIPQPAKVKKTGYYPTKYSIKKNGAEYVISFTDFVYKQAQ